MAKLPLDLKDFKKSASDKHTTTLKHKSGHEIKLAHAALSPEMRANLAKLPMPKAEAPKKMADGGPVVEPISDQEANAMPPQQAPAAPAAPPVTINIAPPQAAPAPQMQPPAQDVSTPPVTNPEYIQHNVNAGIAQVPQVSTPAIVPAHVPGILPQAPEAPAPMQSPEAAAQAQDPYGMGQMAQSSMDAVNQEKAGVMQEARALGDKGAAESKVLEQQSNMLHETQQNYQKHFQELDTERQAFQHDINEQHIDPKRFMNSMGTVGRISSAIGLILGGMGSGLTGGENPALSFLNKQIDRDIESQKAEMGKKENLLSANMRQFGNLKDATDMTRIMQNDLVVNQLKDAAAKAASPMAQAAALKSIGAINLQSAQLQQGLTMKRAMATTMSSIGNNPDKAVQLVQVKRMMGDESGAKALEEKIVPGVGVAQVPVPQEVRESLIAKQTFQKEAQRLHDFAAAHAGSWSPATVATGKAMAAEVSGLYRGATKGGVYKSGEQEFINKIIPDDPTSVFNSVNTLPKLKAIMQSNQIKLEQEKRGVGLQTEHIQEAPPVLNKK